jgi:hypothetical protein
MKTLNQIQSELSAETWGDLVQHFALQKQAFSDEKMGLEASVQSAIKEKNEAVQAANLASAARQAAEADLANALAAKDADQSAAVEAAKLAIQVNLDALVTAAEAAYASGDLDAVAAVIAQARSYTTAARRAKIEADLAAAQAAAAAHAAALAALA